MSVQVIERVVEGENEAEERALAVENVAIAGELAAELGQSPSERDREIYEAVCIQCRGVAEVAREFGLAATTIRNIAHDTQRKLARRQHELDKRTGCETLALYFDRYTEQLAAIDRVWRRSLAEQETVQRTTTRAGRAERQEPGGDPRATMERIVEREAVTVRQPRPDLRCIALANRILRDMQAIEAKFKAERQRERDAQAIAARVDAALAVQPASAPRRLNQPEPAMAASPAALPRQAEPLADRALLEKTLAEADRKARDRAELALLKASLPKPLPGEVRTYTKQGGGAWEAKTRPARARQGGARMSRRERNRLEREKALARSGALAAASATENVSGAPQVDGGQEVATRHP